MAGASGYTVGIVGDGQLARMTALAAGPLGVRVRVLAGGPDESAAQVVPDTVLGDYRDLPTLRDFAKSCDAITFDHEHVPTAHLEALAAEGVAVRPGPHALVFAQDKIRMRQRLGELGLPIPRWRQVSTAGDIAAFAGETGWPVVLKAPRGGYDGKGVWVVGDVSTAEAVFDGTGGVLLAEEHVPFVRELAALVARRPSGQIESWPVVQTVQRNGVCAEVVAPAPGAASSAEAARAAAERIAGELDVTGVLAVEMFETADGRVLVNELAMRPHNSGHWTIDGATVSQFEQHLRAVLDLPLAPAQSLSRCAVMVNLLGGPREHMADAFDLVWAADPAVRVHTYGKAVKPGRKVGHVTLTGNDAEDLLVRGRRAAATLTGEA